MVAITPRPISFLITSEASFRKRWANSPTVRGPVISNFDGRTGACFSRTFDFLSCFRLRPFCPRTEAADFLVRSFSSEPSGTRFDSAGLDFLRAERLELAVGAVAAFADELDADGPFPAARAFAPLSRSPVSPGSSPNGCGADPDCFPLAIRLFGLCRLPFFGFLLFFGCLRALFNIPEELFHLFDHLIVHHTHVVVDFHVHPFEDGEHFLAAHIHFSRIFVDAHFRQTRHPHLILGPISSSSGQTPDR